MAGIKEQGDVNYAEIMPFYSLTDFNIENEFISTIRKFENLMNYEKIENFLKDNRYEQILNPSNVIPCEYFDEEEFSKKYRKGDECLNIFSLNIRSLPKHGGELFCFLKDLNTKFHIIVLTEIGSKNISVVENLLPNYNFQYVLPEKNKCGGVGIYTCGSLTGVIVKDNVNLSNLVTVQNVRPKVYLLNFVTEVLPIPLEEYIDILMGICPILYPTLK